MILQGMDFFCKRSPSPVPLPRKLFWGRDWGKVFLLEKDDLSPNPYPRKAGLDRRREFLEMKTEFITEKGKNDGCEDGPRGHAGGADAGMVDLRRKKCW